MIEEASLDDDILHVINISNREAYREIIPKEHFTEPVLSLEELLRDFERMTFYVYRFESRIVGVSALHVQSENTGRIRWVYILPEYQRKRIGTALVTYIEFKAREIGLKRLWLLTSEKACWAVNFYKKLGYKLTEKIEKPWGYDVVMEKDLH
ncbi:MAG: acetyltransferase [Candidatus Bathyarchaeota archaeon BA1]|nr:MAG: acetyltransferase [Candidatus Bathyarchaeota archaeon BA1]